VRGSSLSLWILQTISSHLPLWNSFSGILVENTSIIISNLGKFIPVIKLIPLLHGSCLGLNIKLGLNILKMTWNCGIVIDQLLRSLSLLEYSHLMLLQFLILLLDELIFSFLESLELFLSKMPFLSILLLLFFYLLGQPLSLFVLFMGFILFHSTRNLSLSSFNFVISFLLFKQFKLPLMFLLAHLWLGTLLFPVFNIIFKPGLVICCSLDPKGGPYSLQTKIIKIFLGLSMVLFFELVGLSKLSILLQQLLLLLLKFKIHLVLFDMLFHSQLIQKW